MAMFTKRRPLGEAGTAKSGGFGRTLGIILGVALIAILVMSCFTRVPTERFHFELRHFLCLLLLSGK